MNHGRIIGIVLGVVILIAAFLLPFDLRRHVFHFNTIEYGNLGAIQESVLITLAYITIVSFMLLVIAGIVGFFPLGCGVIGIIALAILTAGHILIYPDIVLEAGAGYFVAWVASIAALVSFWRKGQKAQQQTVNVTVVNQPQTPPPPPSA